MFRTYQVGTTHRDKKLESLFVTDAKNDKELDVRPKAIEFPISVLYDEDTQRRRAQDYCDYLNRLVQAAKDAYEHNKLIDILKA